jgi:hypothetical protein
VGVNFWLCSEGYFHSAYYKFRFYTSKMNEICLHRLWLYFSSIILCFGQCIWASVIHEGSVVDCRHCSQCRQCRHLAVVVEVMFLEGNAQSIWALKYVGTSASRLRRTHAAHMVWWVGLGTAWGSNKLWSLQQLKEWQFDRLFFFLPSYFLKVYQN